ncbi:MAG: 50S ribosomal protein L6 [Phycisphaerae bacterium]|nr:50S ribosomal protein L6 [Phycisphaerae bacterium]
MSRVGKKPISVPSGVDVKVSGRTVTVSSAKGSLCHALPAGISVTVDAAEKQVSVDREADSKRHRALHGLARALLQNMVVGVTQGYERRLEIYGTGYGCDLVGGKLQLNCGFMGRGGKNKAQFEIPVPQGLDVTVEVKAARGEMEPAKFVVRGIDKQLVGSFCADVRMIRKSEPYKGKGIRYQGEQVRRKQGKAFASGGG